MLTMKAVGVRKAQKKLNKLAKTAAAYRGCYLDRPHKGTGSTGKLIKYLGDVKTREADGASVDRVLDYDLNQAESVKVGTAFANEIDRRLQGPVANDSAAAARAISAAAFRAAGKVMLQILSKRATKGLTTGDKEATKVLEEYATWRRNKYSVATREVYKATGELLNNIAPSNNNVSAIKMVK